MTQQNRQDLAGAIEQAGHRASRLYWVHLHVHSPESHDFPTTEHGLAPDDHFGQARWLLEQVRENAPDLRVLGITDHFKCRTACAAARVAPDLGLLVLPGLEIAVRCTEFHEDKIHLLFLFPPSESETVYSLVDALGGPRYDEAGEGSSVDQRIAKVLEEADSRDALCIAAHVNTSQGMRHFIRRTSLELVPAKRREQQLLSKLDRTFEEESELLRVKELVAKVEDAIQARYLTFLSTAGLGAVQVATVDDVVHYGRQHCEPLGLRPVACLLASDAHSPEEVGTSGKATLLRLGELTFPAVKAALGDPETRIRFTPPAEERTVIEGIRFMPLKGTTGGFFGDATIAFSENLTCIIGPRGSGKSAVVEAVRFALERPPRGDDKLRSDATERLQATLLNTSVELLMDPAHQPSLVVERELDGSSSASDMSGKGLDTDVSSSSATNAVIYGWSEIEQLGKDWAAQRELLDGAAPELRSLRDGVTSARAALEENRNNAVSSARQICQLSLQLEALPDLKRELEALDAPELRQAFEKADRASRVRSLVKTAREQLVDLVEDLLDADTAQPIDLREPLREWSNNLLAGAKEQKVELPPRLTSKKFDRIRDQLLAALDQTPTTLSDFLSAVTEAEEDSEKSLKKAELTAESLLLHAYKEDLDAGRETVETVKRKAEQRNAVKQEYSELLETQRKRDEEREQLRALLGHRHQELVPTFVHALRQISTWRQKKAEKITERLARFAARAPVTVGIGELDDRSAFAQHLYDAEQDEGLLRNSKIYAFVQRDIAQRLSAKFLPWEFTEMVRARDTDLLKAVFAADGRGEPVQDAECLVAHLWASEAEAADQDADRLDILLRIEEIHVDDRPVIMLQGTPIEHLSPGQRCTALMPIILTEGDYPLVVDQPEDNLDNTMVFHVLVDVLRQLKDQRQVIVATHNPNIPVSGDAEHVVVLDSKTLREGEVVDQGAIDLPSIIEHVIEIMEGGREAFEIRARKYGYEIRRRGRGE